MFERSSHEIYFAAVLIVSMVQNILTAKGNAVVIRHNKTTTCVRQQFERNFFLNYNYSGRQW